MPTVRCVCNRRLSFKPEQAGKTVACPVCKATVRLPAGPFNAPKEQPSQPQTQPQPEPKPQAQPETPPSEPAKAELTLEPLEPEQEKMELMLEPLDEEEKAPESTYSLDIPTPPPPPEPEEIKPEPAAAPPPPAPSITSDESKSNFWKSLGPAFAYPLTLNGFIALAIAIFVFIGGHYLIIAASKVDFIRALVTRLVHLTLIGAATGYVMSIMKASARGDNTVPSWPNMFEFKENVFMPFLFLFFPALISTAPAIVYYYFVEKHFDAIFTGILIAGLVYLPMALLALALDNDLHRLNPIPVLKAIIRVPQKYAVLWVMAGLVAATWIFGERLLNPILPITILRVLIYKTLCLYLAFITARIAGLLYYNEYESLKHLEEYPEE